MKVIDSRRTGFFLAEHAIFDQWGNILGAHRIVVYLCVVSHASYKDKSGYPSYATIAEKCDLSRRKVIDCVSDLVFLRFLDKKTRKNEKAGDPDSNIYYILDIPDIHQILSVWIGKESDIPDKHQWLIPKLLEYRDINKGNNKIGSAQNALGKKKEVVHEVHQGSAQDALGVVHEVHQGSAQDAPKIHTSNNTHIKETHLLTFNSLVWDYQLKNINQIEREYVCNELNKLKEEESTEKRQAIAQLILDEANSKIDKIKLSLTVYIKGLVTKANNGNFTPTSKLALKRKKAALEREKTTRVEISRGDKANMPKMPEIAQGLKLSPDERKQWTSRLMTLMTQQGKTHSEATSILMKEFNIH